jgi:aryl-alcohol dehydrogenase-like predicted oxidoreductase
VLRPIDRVVFGCVALSAMRTRKEAFRLLEDVVAAGVRHFDTARLYGQGFSEKILGEFLRAHGPELRVTTKVGLGPLNTASVPTWLALPLNHTRSTLRRGGATASPASASQTGAPEVRRGIITRDALEASLAESLRQLGRQQVDILLLHESLPEHLSPDAWEILESAKTDGVVGRLGVGTNRALLEARFSADTRIEVLQYEGSSASRSPLMDRFSDALHIHHSIFRGAAAGSHGDVLRRALETNPNGRVIFSTRSKQHLRENLRALE